MQSCFSKNVYALLWKGQSLRYINIINIKQKTIRLVSLKTFEIENKKKIILKGKSKKMNALVIGQTEFKNIPWQW